MSQASLALAATGGGFPIVASETPRLIDVLDAEHHLHGLADFQRLGVNIREVDHHPAALFKLDHAVAGGRIGRVGQPVGGVVT